MTYQTICTQSAIMQLCVGFIGHFPAMTSAPTAGLVPNYNWKLNNEIFKNKLPSSLTGADSVQLITKSAGRRLRHKLNCFCRCIKCCREFCIKSLDAKFPWLSTTFLCLLFGCRSQRWLKFLFFCSLGFLFPARLPSLEINRFTFATEILMIRNVQIWGIYWFFDLLTCRF